MSVENESAGESATTQTRTLWRRDGRSASLSLRLASIQLFLLPIAQSSARAQTKRQEAGLNMHSKAFNSATGATYHHVSNSALGLVWKLGHSHELAGTARRAYA